MQRITQVMLVGLAAAALFACSQSAESEEAGGESAPTPAGKAAAMKKAPAGGGAPATLNPADFQVSDDVITPEEARAKAAEEITEENAEEAFQALKSAIENGG
ncbi:MAG: hypothetical protein AAF682_19955 [Planctomycetota bacterium]